MLSSRDLEKIREVVREEIRAALGLQRGTIGGADGTASSDEISEEGSEDRQARPDRMLPELRARARRPIPKDRYLGSYDAARLAGATAEKIRAWVQAGKLTNHGHKMKLLIDREQLLALRRP